MQKSKMDAWIQVVFFFRIFFSRWPSIG